MNLRDHTITYLTIILVQQSDGQRVVDELFKKKKNDLGLAPSSLTDL